MDRARGAGESKRDTNAKTIQLVQLISEIGPDIPEIARRLGQFKESVRYRYKNRILDKGLAVQAVLNHEKLGLRQLEVIVFFPEEIREYAQSILTSMSELCYVTSFEKLMPQGQYLVGAAVPNEFVRAYIGFLDSLRRKGVFSSIDVHIFDWFKRPPMQAQFYDFSAGRWDFDWSTKSTRSFEAEAYTPSTKSKFDYTDLLVLKELRVDAAQSMVWISRKLRTNYKKLIWHYRTHIIKSGLISGYTVRWPGTKYESRIERALHRQHAYFWVDLIVRDLNEVERMALMSNISRLPFLWAEAGGKDYFAQLAFPVDYFTEAMQYLAKSINPVRERANLYLMDQTDALAFTISYKLYDEQRRTWTLEVSSLLEKFEGLILRIKEKGG